MPPSVGLLDFPFSAEFYYYSSFELLNIISYDLFLVVRIDISNKFVQHLLRYMNK